MEENKHGKYHATWMWITDREKEKCPRFRVCVFDYHFFLAANASVTLSPKKDVGHIYELWVDEKSRRQGFGSRTLDAIEYTASMENIKRLTLWVAQDNEAAIRLYEKFGFRYITQNPINDELFYVKELQ